MVEEVVPRLSPQEIASFTPTHSLFAGFAPDRMVLGLLATEIGPLLDRMVADGSIDGWFFDTFFETENGETRKVVGFTLVGGKREQGEEILRKAREKIGPRLSAADGVLHETRRDESVFLSSFVYRMGSPKMASVVLDFYQMDTKLILESVRSMGRAPTPGDLQRAGLIRVFHYMRSLGIPNEERFRWIYTWLNSFAAKRQKDWLDRHKIAAEEALKSPQFVEFLDQISSSETDLLSPLSSEFDACLSRFKAELRDSAPTLPPGKPLYFMIFYSLIHVHLLRLGISNDEEAFLLWLGALHLQGVR